ncbi:MAG: hypothetical protein DHS20C15_23840 [Planctomycetota bacterium]|nr:MAG: hypothetical protein DHS20C15_23840 [Planctomycetota bacterium]
MLDRDADTLGAVCREVVQRGAEATPLVADLSDLDALPALARRAREHFDGLDVVIHNAGLISFRPFEAESAAGLQKLLQVNLTAPMLLTRELLPELRATRGHVLNVGSIFGSIAFAYFASYSASKFAMRGWSEALRRELAGSGVHVHYVAPRATRTALANSFGRMAEAVGMKLDTPEWVASRVVKALSKDRKDTYLGFPECFFVRLNALLPRFVDRALRKQDAATRPFAEEAAALTSPR